jgi:hypothetical protein
MVSVMHFIRPTTNSPSINATRNAQYMQRNTKSAFIPKSHFSIITTLEALSNYSETTPISIRELETKVFANGFQLNALKFKSLHFFLSWGHILA